MSWVQKIITTLIVDFQVGNMGCVHFAAVLNRKGNKKEL